MNTTYKHHLLTPLMDTTYGHHLLTLLIDTLCILGSIKIRIFLQINFRHLYRGTLGPRGSKCERIFKKYQFPPCRFKL